MAKEIAGHLGFQVVSLDSYLRGDGKPYLEQLNWEALRNGIMASGSSIVIEGILALKILDELHMDCDYHIFMKLYNGTLGWDYEQYLGTNKRQRNTKSMPEIVQYYMDYKPFERCDLVLNRHVS